MRTETFPVITAAQMSLIDQLAAANGLSIEMMMEHAGLHIARFTADYILKKFSADEKKHFPDGAASQSPLLQNTTKNSRTEKIQLLILTGKGHNGGDSLAAARHLKNWGFEPYILLSNAAEELKPDSRRQYELLNKINLKIEIWKSTEKQRQLFQTADLILDGLLGHPATKAPRTPIKDLIELTNAWGKDVLAIDIPSGLNADTGKANDPCIKAKATLTLALPKTGLMKPEATPFVGDLFVADLGIPDFIFQKAKIEIPSGFFQKNSIVKITTG